MGYVIGFYGFFTLGQQWWVLNDHIYMKLDVDVQIEADIHCWHPTLLASSGAVWKIPGDVDTLNPPFFPMWLAVEPPSLKGPRVPWMILWIAIQKISTFRKEHLQELQFFNSTGTYGYLHEITGLGENLQEPMVIYMKYGLCGVHFPSAWRKKLLSLSCFWYSTVGFHIFLGTGWGPQSIAFSCLIRGWILWFMVDITN